MDMLKRLSESELDVMLVVWRAQEALDTGEVARRLQKGWKIQAVQVVLGRLVKKGYLSCEKIGRLNYYTPLVAEADYRAAETETFVEKLYRNSPKSLIAALVQSQPLSKEDFEEIRALLDRGEES
jgi:BlaI family penicillinase repressor